MFGPEDEDYDYNDGYRDHDQWYEEDDDSDSDDEPEPHGDDDHSVFADPGGESALRAATPGNPRIHPCPTCESPNRLTQLDVALGYQCNTCASQDELGF